MHNFAPNLHTYKVLDHTRRITLSTRPIEARARPEPYNQELGASKTRKDTEKAKIGTLEACRVHKSDEARVSYTYVNVPCATISRREKTGAKVTTKFRENLSRSKLVEVVGRTIR